MESPGIKNLGDYALTTAVTGLVITDGTAASGENQAFIDQMAGALAASFEVRFVYGSGGTNCKVYIQTSLDQGTVWVDVACATFTTASAVKVVNLSGLTPKTTAVTPADGALSDDTCVDGILGDRFRAKITSTGTYAGSTTVAVRMTVR